MFRHGGATRDYIEKIISLAELKDRKLWKPSLLYTAMYRQGSYLLYRRSNRRSREFLNTLNNSACCYLSVAEVRAASEEFVTES